MATFLLAASASGAAGRTAGTDVLVSSSRHSISSQGTAAVFVALSQCSTISPSEDVERERVVGRRLIRIGARPLPHDAHQVAFGDDELHGPPGERNGPRGLAQEADQAARPGVVIDEVPGDEPCAIRTGSEEVEDARLVGIELLTLGWGLAMCSRRSQKQ